MILPLAIPYWATGLLVGGFLIVCVILMLVVLIQRPQGGGLSGAFGAGGGGAGQTAFGTKTGDALTFATIGMFILYLVFAVGLNFATRPENIDHQTVPTVTSTDPVETTESAPLPAEDAETDTAAPGDESAPDADGLAGGLDEGGLDEGAADAVETVEQAANEIVNDAQDAADAATAAPTEPATDTEPAATEPPAEAPAATDPADGETPPSL